MYLTVVALVGGTIFSIQFTLNVNKTSVCYKDRVC